MSDNVNEYGLGAPGSQGGEPVTTETQTDQLAHGLGARDVAHDDHEGEDLPEGGRQNRLEHGLAGTGFRDEQLNPRDGRPDPLGHGLGSPDTGATSEPAGD